MSGEKKLKNTLVLFLFWKKTHIYCTGTNYISNIQICLYKPLVHISVNTDVLISVFHEEM